MSKAGKAYENPVTGEWVVRLGTEESSGELSIADLYVSPGGAVAGEHVHPEYGPSGLVEVEPWPVSSAAMDARWERS